MYLVDCYKWIINAYNLNLFLACVGEQELCFRYIGYYGEVYEKCCEKGLDCIMEENGLNGFCRSTANDN